jgi:hypothetical protein
LFDFRSDLVHPYVAAYFAHYVDMVRIVVLNANSEFPCTPLDIREQTIRTVPLQS